MGWWSLLKFIKFLPIIFLAVLVTACNGDTYKYFYFPEFFYDDQGELVISYEANMDNPNNIKKYAKFNTETYKWEASEVVKKVIADEQIATFGKTIIKNSDNAVVFEQSIPSISDIQSQTDIPLPNAEAYYNYFRTGNDYRWDRKTILIKVGINKKTDKWGENSFTGIHSFLAEYDEINSLWNIKHLGKVPGNRGNSADLNVNHPSNFSLFTASSAANIFFINSNPSLCHRWLVDGTYSLVYNKLIKCLVKYDNGEVSLKKLYGEILPAQYVDVLLGMEEAGKIRNGPAPSRVFFDEKQNMYVLYNDTEEAKGKYFYFEMYKPDNPTVAEHKQKIY
jgi:hypothetical protein